MVRINEGQAGPYDGRIIIQEDAEDVSSPVPDPEYVRDQVLLERSTGADRHFPPEA